MARSVVVSLVVISAFSIAGAALAGEDDNGTREVSPQDVKTGELRITMNTDYAKVELDGEPFEDTEFENNGRIMIIPKLDRTSVHELKILPVYPDLEPTVIKVRPSDWKLVRVARHVKMWRAKKKVKFSRKSPVKDGKSKTRR